MAGGPAFEFVRAVPRGPRALLGAGAALAIAHAILGTLSPGTPAGTAVATSVYLVACAALLWRTRVDRDSRGLGLALALAVGLWCFGFAYRDIVHGHGAVPYPSVSDYAWLSFYVGAYAATIALLRRTSVERHIWADGLLAGAVVVALTLTLILPGLDAGGSAGAGAAVNVAYPLADSFLVALLVVGGSARSASPQLRVLMVAFALQVVADGAWFILHILDAYRPGGPLDAAFGAITLLYALAAWQPATSTAPAVPRRQVALTASTAAAAAALLFAGSLRPIPPVAAVLALLSLVGCAVRFLAVVRHASALRRDRDEALAAARSDDLTGLGNRRALLEDLDRSLGAPQSAGEPLSLAVFSLRRLLDTNRVHGVGAGDARLRALAAVLRATGGRAYRIDGSVFALVLPGRSGWEAFLAAQDVGERLRAAGDAAGACAGVAAAGTGVERDLLLERADAALVEALDHARGAILWSPEIGSAQLEGVDVERERHARSLAGALAKAVDAKDAYTRSHCETVAEACVLIGRQLELPDDRIAALRLGGLLHDVGKIGIPDAVLQKPGRLTDDEFALMRTHAPLGAEIVASAGLDEQARWIRHHHERVDGGGYPDGLHGPEIPLESRIILVADAFEAITSDRPYRKGRSPAVAFEELDRHAGTQFDPACVAALRQALTDRPDAFADAPPTRAGSDAPVGPVEQLVRREGLTPAAVGPTPAAGGGPSTATAAADSPASAREDELRPGRRRALVAAALIALVQIATVVVGEDAFPGRGLYAVWTTLLIVAAAAVAAAASRSPVRGRWAGALLGGAFAVWALGDGLWWLAGGQDAPVPSVADPFYLAFYPLAAAGLVCLRGNRGLPRDLGLWLDAGIAAAGAAALLAVTVTATALSTLEGGPLALVVTGAYPVGDLVLIGMLAWTVALGRRITAAWAAAALGIVIFTASDLVFMHQVAAGTFREGTVVDLGWALAAPLFAAAAWLPDAAPLSRRRVERPRQIGIAAGFALISLTVLVVGHFSPINAVGLVLAALTIVAVLARMVVGVHATRTAAAASHAEAHTDALTRLGNRRALLTALDQRLGDSAEVPCLLLLFDLDGFKDYNDTFGHPAGDALLARLGGRLAATLPPDGRAYRMGGDEFCVLVPIAGRDSTAVARTCAEGLTERGRGFAVTGSHGAVLLPDEAADTAAALRLADQRLYQAKRNRRASAGAQAADVLSELLRQRDPRLGDHLTGVAELADAVGRRLGVAPGDREILRQAALLHDIGKMAMPQSLLDKRDALSPEERAYLERHPLIAEKVLRTAPALGRAAALVRSSRERFDGSGYPDRLTGSAIPLGARIIAVCDAFDAMITADARSGRRTTMEALEELLAASGAQFDPSVVAAFVSEMSDRAQFPVSDGRPALTLPPASAPLSG